MKKNRPTGLKYNIKVKNKSWFKKGDITLGRKKGCVPWNKGKLMSNTFKKRVSKGTTKAMKLVSVEKLAYWKGKKHPRQGQTHYRWIEDRTLLLYSDDWTDDLREAIRKRDNYICQECGIHQDELKGFNKKLDIHHIDYDKNNCNPDNLMALCRKCHIKTNFNREYWKQYFQQL